MSARHEIPAAQVMRLGGNIPGRVSDAATPPVPDREPYRDAAWIREFARRVGGYVR